MKEFNARIEFADGTYMSSYHPTPELARDWVVSQLTDTPLDCSKMSVEIVLVK
jgi:hypothetical protein